MSDENQATFKITDRRKFNADGTPRDQGVDAAPAAESQIDPATGPAPEARIEEDPPHASPVENFQPATGPTVSAAEPKAQTEVRNADAKAAAQRAEQAYGQAGGRPKGAPEASFLSLIDMLAMEAALHLGMIRPKDHDPPPIDLESSRHLIDLLGVLQEKTRGNLNEEEAQLLEDMLARLRMQFVALSTGR